VSLLEYTLLTGGALAGVLALILGFTWLWSWLGSRLYQPPRAAEAIRIVWSYYGMPMDRCPQVYWVKGRTYTNPFGDERYGESFTYRNAVQVAHVPGTDISETALSHELWHKVLAARGMDTPNHEDMGFRPGGMVDGANEALKAAGL